MSAMPKCEKCGDTGLVKVDELDEQQPCLWCNIGQELFWATVKVETCIHKFTQDS